MTNDELGRLSAHSILSPCIKMRRAYVPEGFLLIGFNSFI